MVRRVLIERGAMASEPVEAITEAGLAAATSPLAEEASDADPFLSLKRGATEIYLIRHADALPDAEEVVHGGYDQQALSALGRQQGQALGERLRATALAAVYSSPIGRARQTAAYVAAAQGHEVLIEQDLREVALGAALAVPEGATPEEIAVHLRARLRRVATEAVTIGIWSRMPGAEPSAVLRARLFTVVNRLAAQHAGQRIAVVSHAAAINAYVAVLLGIERDYFFPAANTSLSVVRVRGERRLLLALNDVAHLRDAGLLGAQVPD